MERLGSAQSCRVKTSEDFEIMSKDKRYYKIMNSQRWQNLRWQKLNVQPLCERCLSMGKIFPANQVHHIKPIESANNMADMKRLGYAFDNLMSVCDDCHHAIHDGMRSHRFKPADERKAERKQEIDDFFRSKFG